MSSTESPPVVVDTAPRQRRSVFGNYSSVDHRPKPEPASLPSGTGRMTASDNRSVELALLRSFAHQFLARAFDYPEAETWAWLTAAGTRQVLEVSVTRLEPGPSSPLRTTREALARCFVPAGFSEFHDDYITAIGHAARGSCPINEIEYGDIKADPLFQPHRLADLGAFYRAFGLEVGARSDERHDHLSVELEFMGVLTAQEAHLLNAGVEAAEALRICREGQRKFLREHLGRWSPAFNRRLHRAVGEHALGLLACFALAFIESECRRAGVAPGSEDLLLRPADESAALCDGCGLKDLPPGAVPPV
ncbi:MAG: molecular chaperone TorD family protein [Verrucomicrobia bacterium]|nr:molecular chaperone TorD family protein [Verrucomicrobiota bacterium]